MSLAGRLRQQLCWDVVRILATKTCPGLPTSFRTAEILRRVEGAACKMNESEYDFKLLNRGEGEQIKEWIEDIRSMRRDHDRRLPQV